MTKYSMSNLMGALGGSSGGSNSGKGIPSLGPNDIVIAVMGVTGAGKTTFIQHFTTDTLAVGHGLESCTAQVAIHPCHLPDGTRFYLVDTPGFDDTYRTDVDILREIASWLSEAYANKISLAGIVYLHRVSDTRIGGEGMKNLRMFKKLCGDNSLANVVLATTMWSQVNPEEAIKREQQLTSKSDFWKYMIDQGSQVFRQDAGQDSAIAIVRYLVDRKRPITLDIQVDMVDKKLTLDQTAAGKEVEGEIAKQRKIYEEKMEKLRKEMDDAMKKKDDALKEELAEYRAEIEEKMQKDRDEMERMRASKDELRQQLQEQHEQQRREFESALKESNDRIVREEFNLKMMRQNHESDLRVKELEFKLEQERVNAAYWKRKDDDSCLVM